MIKTLKFGDTPVRLSNNIQWTFIYRDQFGHDIVPVIMPMISGFVNFVVSMLESTDGDKVTVQDILKVLDADKISDVLIELSGLRFTDFVNIIWCMAKAEDDTLPEPRQWVTRFDVFPVDVVFPEAWHMIIEGMVSKKNLERLQKATSKMQAGASDLTKLSSQVLKGA